MKNPIKVKQGKLSSQAGKRFELLVRADLEEKCWIVDKWTNNVELSTWIEQDDDGEKFFDKVGGIKKITGELVKAKAKWNNFTKSMMMGSGGFPDFIALRNILINPRLGYQYEVMGVECKMSGVLDKAEKEKCRWLLENRIFQKILIAEKTKVKNKVVIVYHDFEVKYPNYQNA